MLTPCIEYRNSNAQQVPTSAMPVSPPSLSTDFQTPADGGSCQVGISYDMLKTVAIMASWIGGCPLEGKYTFKVPDIPGADKALFWWSWFNRTGNREMYNNAAVLAVSSSATSFTGPQPFRANSTFRGAFWFSGKCSLTVGKCSLTVVSCHSFLGWHLRHVGGY